MDIADLTKSFEKIEKLATKDKSRCIYILRKRDSIYNHIISAKDPLIPEIGQITEFAEQSYSILAKRDECNDGIDYGRANPDALTKLPDLLADGDRPIWISGQLSKGRYGILITVDQDAEDPAEKAFAAGWWAISGKIVFIPAIAVVGKTLRHPPSDAPIDAVSTPISLWVTPGIQKLIKIACDEDIPFTKEVESQAAKAMFLLTTSAAGLVMKRAENGKLASFLPVTPKRFFSRSITP